MIYHKQKKEWSCWPACVKMILNKLWNDVTEDFLIKALESNHNIWTKNKNIISFFKEKWIKFIYKTNGSIEEMDKYLEWYIILIRYHLPKTKEDHYALYIGIKHNRIHLWDPWYGKNHTYSIDYFNKHRRSNWEGFEKGFIAVKKTKISL